jgi:hypothetical protein
VTCGAVIKKKKNYFGNSFTLSVWRDFCVVGFLKRKAMPMKVLKKNWK